MPQSTHGSSWPHSADKGTDGIMNMLTPKWSWGNAAPAEGSDVTVQERRDPQLRHPIGRLELWIEACATSAALSSCFGA